MFEQVKQLMIERRLAVSAALKVLGITRPRFYRNLTELQKAELRHIKVSFAERGNKENF
jgi:hypothetical protein